MTAPLLPEPPPGSVVSWQARFTPDGAIYSYVAIHVAGLGWFASDANECAYSWAGLCTYLIGLAPIHIVTSWGVLR